MYTWTLSLSSDTDFSQTGNDMSVESVKLICMLSDFAFFGTRYDNVGE